MNDQYVTDYDLLESLLSVADIPRSKVLGSSQIRTGLEIKNLMDQMPGGFFIYHADDKEELIYANKALLRIFGCDTMEEFRSLTGNSFRGIVHPEDLEEVEKSIWEQISQSHHDLDYVEYRIIRKDGTVCWVEDYGHFVRSQAAGDIFYVFIGETTEKRKRLKAEHTQRLEVIEGLSADYESILYVDLDANTVFPYRLSSRTSQMFGGGFHTAEYERFLSDYIRTWVHAEDRPAVERAIAPANIRDRLSAGRIFYVNFRTVDGGETQYLQLRIAGVGAGGHISRIVLGTRRVDEEIRHEMEQKKMFEDAWNHARLANITKSTFLSNMSHDMRTPLNAITGYTALARKYMDEPDRLLDCLDKITASGDHLLRLVNHILELSRMESGAIEVTEAEERIEQIVEEATENILPRAKAGNLQFCTDLSGLTHHLVRCDRQKLVQILIYLCGNAVKYTESGGRILLTVKEETEPASEYAHYRFIIKDSGIGIEEKYLQNIFEPFERVSNTTSCGVFGTGLGLTLARNLVNMMGGRIDVKSTPHAGSEFTVTLRLRIQKEQRLSGREAREAAIALLGRKRILLVDDNELNLEIEAELFEDLGLFVDRAENGREALNRITASPAGTYALVLMDIQMPVMNGYDAARAIRALADPLRAQLPIIALSANAFDEDRRRSMDSGMNAHLAKPLDMTAFLELIVSLLQ